MKKNLAIGLILSMTMCITGFIGFIANWFSGVSGNIIKPEVMLIYWLIAAIGQALSITLIILAIISIYRKRQPVPVSDGQPKSSVSGQIVFSFINLFAGGFLFSALFALYALSNAVNAKYEPSYQQAEHRLKTARKLNIIGAVIIGFQNMDLVLVMIFAFKGMVS